VKHPRPLAGILSMGVGTLVAVGTIAIVRMFTPVIIVPALGASLLAYAIGHWAGRANDGT
jgi:hypothetical protein